MSDRVKPRPASASKSRRAPSKGNRRSSNKKPADDAAGSPIRRFFLLLGPGLISGASDDDPSGIATYAQAGATFKYTTLWTVPVTLPMMMAVQEICDRTALVTGKSLGTLAREKFGQRIRIVVGVLLVALVAANTLNLAADLMAIGQGMALLHAGPAPLWSAIAGVAIAAALIFGSVKTITKIFKWLCVALLSYIGVLFATHLNWGSVWAGLVGIGFSFKLAYLGIIVAILGTTISPYLFFWESAQRIEELRDENPHGDTARPLSEASIARGKKALLHTRIDVFTGMGFSALVMFAIIAATAATLGDKGESIGSAADAAKALEPIAGPASSVLFALGFIGSGVLAVPVLAASGSAGLAGLLGKPWGLERSPKKAPVFYGLIAVGTIGGTVLAVIGLDPIRLLVFSATVNGIAAAPFLIVTMLIARDKKLMGKHRNGRLASTIGWVTAGVMCIAGVIGLWQTLTGG
jgi:NRAMP (natural resistance-associated macrophage protein)-like metal ion transporter